MIIVKTPGINGLGKTKGTRNAGNLIIEELKKISVNEKGKEVDVWKMGLEEIHVNNDNLEEQEKLIYENAFEIIKNNEKAFFIGGDHSISFSIGKAFLENCKNKREKPCLIVFDSHADCMKAMKEPTHEEWLRALIENGFPAGNILLVGLRKIEKQELEFFVKNKIKIIKMNELNNNLEETTDVLMEFANGKELYVSVDIDVVDPAYSPSVAYPEAGGLTARQMIYIASRIGMMKNLRVFDICEIDSEKDKQTGNITAKLAGKFLGEVVG